jgi:GxxExxY protein
MPMPNDFEDLPIFEPDAELDALTHVVIGAAIEVHRQIGPGLDEASYATALAIEFRLRRIVFEKEVVVPVSYKGHEIGTKRIDFIVGRRLIVELKAIEEVAKVHYAQVRTYLKITGMQLGLLLNFNTAVLKDGIKRIIRA